METPQLPPLDIQRTLGDSAQPFADAFDAVFHDVQLSQSPPRALRKSLSVDSLAVSPPRTHKELPHPPSRGFVAGLASAFRRESNSDLRSTRNRGASVSSIREKQPQVESDVDRHPLPDRDHRFRRPSLRGADHAKPTVRGGELPLPARTSTSAHDPVTPTNIPPDQAVPAQNPTSRRIVNAPANSGRTRSMSNGTQSQQPHKRMAVNTQFSTVCEFYTFIGFTIEFSIGPPSSNNERKCNSCCDWVPRLRQNTSYPQRPFRFQPFRGTSLHSAKGCRRYLGPNL